MKQVLIKVKFVYYVIYLMQLPMYINFTIGEFQNVHLCLNHIQPYLSYVLPNKLI